MASATAATTEEAAALTLSAEACGGVSLTQAGFSGLLFDAGGYL